MSNLPIGQIIEGEAKRDAIHVAVAPVVAGEKLKPGEHIALLENGEAVLTGGVTIGIVDPYLRQAVMPGQRFWMFLYPQTVTGLRHDWTHPAFKEESMNEEAKPDKAASEKWLREFCRNDDVPSYDLVIAAAVRGTPTEGEDTYGTGCLDGEYLFFYGMDACGEIPPEFWDHVEVVAGVKIGPEKRAKKFSCSC